VSDPGHTAEVPGEPGTPHRASMSPTEREPYRTSATSNGAGADAVVTWIGLSDPGAIAPGSLA